MRLRQTASQNWRITSLERRVEALERALLADTLSECEAWRDEPREDDPDTPSFNEATGDYRKPGGAS